MVERRLGQQLKRLLAIVVEELHRVLVELERQRFQERDVARQQLVVARKVEPISDQVVDAIVRQNKVWRRSGGQSCAERASERVRVRAIITERSWRANVLDHDAQCLNQLNLDVSANGLWAHNAQHQ